VEALYFPIRARPVWLRFEVSDGVSLEQATKLAAAGVLPGIVGDQPLRADAVALVEGERAFEEANDGCCLLVVVDLGVGEAGVALDNGVDDVDPVQVAAVLASPVAGDAMAGSLEARTRDSSLASAGHALPNLRRCASHAHRVGDALLKRRQNSCAASWECRAPPIP
jgi:hypothetical protein